MLMTAHRSGGYKALACFLQEQGSLIEKYMPGRVIASSKYNKGDKTQTQKDKEIRILKQKLCAFEKKEGSHTTRVEMEDKYGKCPLC